MWHDSGNRLSHQPGDSPLLALIVWSHVRIGVAKAPNNVAPNTGEVSSRDELPGDFKIFCSRTEGTGVDAKVSLEYCRTICSEFPSYRECRDYLG